MNQVDLFQAKILIIDDLDVNVTFFEALLRSEGYENVYGTTSPRKGLELYRTIRPELVLLDLNMPHMDGFQVMEKIKELEHDSYPPILVLTGLSDHEVRLRALEHGARDFLCKPFEQVEALARIRNMVEVRLLHNAVRAQNRELEARVHERTRELRETQLEIIRRLGRAAEYRDNETGMHVIRMSQYCARLGRAVGLSEEECELLLYASPMHDLGKIGIPDRILLKHGQLEEEEWEIMKTHTLIGADLLAGHNSELMQLASLLALCHHERWDGTGYPRRLAGEAIPIQARITALCDVFDALTSERPYKPAWTVEATLAEIDRQKGIHFDPELVRLLHNILPEILEIKARYSDTPNKPEHR
ncbi:MAG: response regulator [Blastocatellia bacterium]|nr:response regulator [Blastocatellia bacterium]